MAQKQPIQQAWCGHSFEEMKQNLRNHTIKVLSLLKENGITPRWVQMCYDSVTLFLLSINYC